MKAVMYGGGNIGRGFIGALLSQSGYSVTFVDVADNVVQTLQKEKKYPVRIVSTEGHEDIEIRNVDAVQGNDVDAVANAIAQADILATAVGVNVLPYIIPNLVAGIRKRFETTDKPLNILICENLMDANKVLERMLKEKLTAQECALFDERIGLVETSIGRMVPVQTTEMQDGNPLRVCVESYGYLPVDKDAFKGEIPVIQKTVPFSPFGFYLKRKLYIHNMGHSICAYLGLYTGETYIYEAIANPYILLIVKGAMQESMLALAQEHSVPAAELLNHIDDLLRRFTNSALLDTCARVGQDPTRKLSPTDRLIGAATLCKKHTVLPVYITLGAAAALHRYLLENNQLQTTENALKALDKVAHLGAEDALCQLIIEMYEQYRQGTSPQKLRILAEKKKSACLVQPI